jgi:hypothetical protein
MPKYIDGYRVFCLMQVRTKKILWFSLLLLLQLPFWFQVTTNAQVWFNFDVVYTSPIFSDICLYIATVILFGAYYALLDKEDWLLLVVLILVALLMYLPAVLQGTGGRVFLEKWRIFLSVVPLLASPFVIYKI